MHSKSTLSALSKSKSQRIGEALTFMRKYPDVSARKATQVYDITPSSISKRLAGKSHSQEAYATSQQLLTPVEEQVLTKWALQYHASANQGQACGLATGSGVYMSV